MVQPIGLPHGAMCAIACPVAVPDRCVVVDVVFFVALVALVPVARGKELKRVGQDNCGLVAPKVPPIGAPRSLVNCCVHELQRASTMGPPRRDHVD